MSCVLDIIDFFNYIGNVKKGETLFFRRRKYLTKYSVLDIFLKCLCKETLDYQSDIILYNIFLYTQFIKDNKELYYINNKLNNSLDNMYQGLTILSKTYNNPEILEILLGRVEYYVNKDNIK